MIEKLIGVAVKVATWAVTSFFNFFGNLLEWIFN